MSQKFIKIGEEFFPIEDICQDCHFSSQGSPGEDCPEWGDFSACASRSGKIYTQDEINKKSNFDWICGCWDNPADMVNCGCAKCKHNLQFFD